MRKIVIFALLGLFIIVVGVAVRRSVTAYLSAGSAGGVRGGPKELSAADAELIAKNYPDAQKTPSGLLYVMRVPGSGPTPRVGSRVTAHYEGRLLNGTKFDSSYARNSPLLFQVGVGRVVAGWDEAFLGMRKGEKRTLILPYWLGYGEAGRSPIPPRATLVFEVELLDFTP